MDQLLLAYGVSDAAVWSPILSHLAEEAVAKLSPGLAVAHGNLDPRFYIKVCSAGTLACHCSGKTLNGACLLLKTLELCHLTLDSPFYAVATPALKQFPSAQKYLFEQCMHPTKCGQLAACLASFTCIGEEGGGGGNSCGQQHCERRGVSQEHCPQAHAAAHRERQNPSHRRQCGV